MLDQAVSEDVLLGNVYMVEVFAHVGLLTAATVSTQVRQNLVPDKVNHHHQISGPVQLYTTYAHR